MYGPNDYATARMPLPVILAVGGALLLASSAVYVARRALGLLVPDEPDFGDYPNVCPGCYRVNAPCASWCPDLAMAIERDDAAMRGDDEHGDSGWDDEDLPW